MVQGCCAITRHHTEGLHFGSIRGRAGYTSLRRGGNRPPAPGSLISRCLAESAAMGGRLSGA